MTDNTQVEATEAAVQTTETQDESANNNVFTQEQLDRIIEDRLAKQKRAFEKRYDGVDVSRYQELVEQQEAKKLEDAKARGEFEKILKDNASKYSHTIDQLRGELHSVKVDGAVLSAANELGAINAQQVSALLKSQIRLGDDGNVEVLDKNGQIRYNEKGDLYDVKSLVSEFLDANNHFRAATPGGTGSKSNLAPNKEEKFDLAKLDLNIPEHRKIYADAKLKGLV